MLLSTHKAHALALHERIKRAERQIKEMSAELAEYRSNVQSFRKELETENWRLRGDLALYESAHRKADEAVREMKHILVVHKEEISWGTLDTDGSLKARPVDPMTRTRFDELERVVGLAEEFEKSPVPTGESEEWPDIIGKEQV